MEDWLNLELLRTDGVPLVCVNGALDKVCSGYYSNFLNPKLGECAARFFDRFDQAYYLKPIGSGRGWLFRVYGEPWQLFRQTREDLEQLKVIEHGYRMRVVTTAHAGHGVDEPEDVAKVEAILRDAGEA